MFTIILQDFQNVEVERSSVEGNESFLPQDDQAAFPYLSELSDCSYDVFSQSDMAGLIEELKRTRAKLSEEGQKVHVNHVIQLALTCMNTNGYRLCFTPFSS